jgi:hypothetical protein
MEVEKNESQTLRQQHRDWYVALSEEAFPHKGVHSDATEIREWLERLETEHDNQRAALEWSLTSDEWRVASDEWRVASDEWRVTSGE